MDLTDFYKRLAFYQASGLSESDAHGKAEDIMEALNEAQQPKGEETMKQVLLGAIFGSLLTGTIVGAGTFYDQQGHPNAPAGSIQQFDYFRQRQLFLDAQSLRRNQEEQMRQDRLRNPCVR